MALSIENIFKKNAEIAKRQSSTYSNLPDQDGNMILPFSGKDKQTLTTDGHSDYIEPVLKVAVAADERSGVVTSARRDLHWSRRSFHFHSKKIEAAADAAAEARKVKGLFNKVGANIMHGQTTRAYFSYMDTSLGGNTAINTAYRFTRTADINMRRLFERHNGGMGRGYYTRIEDNAHDIHLRFGTQKFNTGGSFFGNWFDYYNYSLATHGRAPGFMFTLGRITGLAMGFMMPQMMMIGFVAKLFTLLGGSKYWYVQPAMALYWNTVNTIYNEILNSMGMGLPATFEDAFDIRTGTVTVDNANERSYIHKVANIMPGIYKQTDGWGQSGDAFAIDVRRVVSRTQALESQLNNAIMKKVKNLKTGEAVTQENLNKFYVESIEKLNDQNTAQEYDGQKGLRAYLNAYLNSRAGKFEANEDGTGQHLNEVVGKEKSGNGSDNFSTSKGDFIDEMYHDDIALSGHYDDIQDVNKSDDSFWNLLLKSMNDGAEFVTFRVDGTSSIGESFSNSSENSQLESIINGWATSRKQLSFNFAGGALFGTVLNGVIDGLQDFIAGGAESLGLSGVTGFILGSNVNIPKTYSGSSVSFPSTTYKLKLRTPYGHPLAIAQDLYLPLAMLLAGVGPLSHGRSAYGGPFYCELYDRGRAVVKNGLITSVQIERATSGVAWTKSGLPLGIDISFTVENLEQSMPLTLMPMSFLDAASPFKSFDYLLNGNESTLMDYVTVLAGMSLTDQIYRSNQIKRNWNGLMRQWDSYWDKDNFAHMIADMAPVSFFKYFSEGTVRR